MNDDSKLIWQPRRMLNGWSPIFAFGVFGLLVFAFSPKDSMAWLMGFIIYFPWAIASLCALIYSLRARVECDEDGVRWRNWRSVWREARWDEIRDFWVTIPKGTTRIIRNVETIAGNFQIETEMDGNEIAIRIAERSHNAKIREWQVKGERLCDDWPRCFEFWQPIYMWGPLFCLATCSLIIVASFPYLARVQPQLQSARFSDWFLAYVGPILLNLPFPLILLFVSLYSSLRACQFRGQSIEVSPDGVIFHGKTSIEAQWTQIQNWQWKQWGRTSVLTAQTPSGEIAIPEFIVGRYALYRIIERFGGVPTPEHPQAWKKYKDNDKRLSTLNQRISLTD